MKVILKITSTLILVFILLLTLFCGTLYANTINEFRQLVNMPSMYDEELNTHLQSVAKEYTSIETNNTIYEYLQSSIKEKNELNEEQYIKTKNLYDLATTLFKNSLKDGICANNVIKYYASLSNLKYQMGKYDITTIDVSYIDNIYKEEYDYASSIFSCLNSGDYDIGNIGGSLKIPLDKSPFTIVKPYGISYTNGITKKQTYNKGIDFKCNKPTNVLAEFIGEITSIVKENGTYTITLQSGTSLKTIYKGLTTTTVVKDQFVNQYDIIGTTNNNLHFEVYLDTQPVNPLIIYGQNGKEAYDKWKQENPSLIFEIQILDNIKNNFKEEKEYSYYNIETKDTEITNGNVILPSSYTKPLVPIIITNEN